MKRTAKFWIDVVATIALFVIDIGIFVIGLLTEKFVILAFDGEKYIVNNSALMIVIALVLVGVLTIYHGCNRFLVSEIIERVDEFGKVHEGVNQIEAHLVNYDRDTIEFNFLTAIESKLGANKKSIQNEIWVLTNNFEENGDSDNAKHLREAIVNNLRNNVTYYYLIPKVCLDELMLLCDKLIEMSETTELMGSFKYFDDDTLDFIPTEYFDILLYLKRTNSNNGPYAENSSQMYYCFSRINPDDKYYYLRVSNEDIKKRMISYAKNYKEKHLDQFKTAIKGTMEKKNASLQ